MSLTYEEILEINTNNLTLQKAQDLYKLYNVKSVVTHGDITLVLPKEAVKEV